MLKELVNKFYADKAKDRREGRDHFYISDAGKCPRKVYFKFKGAPRAKRDPRVLRIFDEGDQVHLRLMGVLTSLGILKASEVDIPPRQLISGRADAIVGIDGGDQLCVVDFKSISSYGFDRLDSPKSNHRKQLQLYMHYFKIPRGILLYENKNNQKLKEFVLRYDQALVEKLLQDFKTLKKQIDQDQIPVIPEQNQGWPKWPCQYCDFSETCKKVENSKLDNWGEEDQGEEENQAQSLF